MTETRRGKGRQCSPHVPAPARVHFRRNLTQFVSCRQNLTQASRNCSSLRARNQITKGIIRHKNEAPAGLRPSSLVMPALASKVRIYRPVGR